MDERSIEVIREVGQPPDIASDPCSGAARHSVDGAVNGWTGASDAVHEWSNATRFPGTHGIRYVATCGPTLHLLNDLQARDDAPIPPDCYGLFYLNLSGDVFVLRVFGDQRLLVRATGDPYEGTIEGAAGFATSPEQPLTRHALVEVALEQIGPGSFALCQLDPIGTSACNDDELLVEESTIVTGELRDDGSIEANAVAELPFVTSLDPPIAEADDEVIASGFRFGAAEGGVYVDDTRAAVVSWQGAEVRFVMPALGPGKHRFRLFAGKREAPAVTLRVPCIPACDGHTCGPDGCGGSCGACPPAKAYCDEGTCVCAPRCEGLHCGPDGCGGDCGPCPPGDRCEDGVCLCVPDCEGKECGTNNCGSTCGACPAGTYCKQWECRCEPQCQDRQCGPDGCAGVCGVCPEAQPCIDGTCLCAPKCEGKECGDDGCVGSCGACPSGLWCAYGVCGCLPNCLNRDCGADDCGGVCGVCQPGETCIANHCH